MEWQAGKPEKTFKKYLKSFGETKSVITFAAPKEGKRLQHERDLEAKELR